LICCQFLEPSAGPETQDTPGETTECEVHVMPDGVEVPVCVKSVE
jgi:hypothetical protein